MVENPNGKVNGKKINVEDDDSDVEELEAQLNEIESALDILESQNDNIHLKLKELLESNREIRKEMVDLGILSKQELPTPRTSSSHVNSDVPQLQKLHNLTLESNYGTNISNGGNKTNRS